MRPLLTALLFLLLAPSASAQKDLYWKAVDVEARVDAQGTIHMTERQTFVFNGDWNGGERIFRLEKGQRFALQGMSRVSDTGEVVPMQSGSLDEVDHFAFTDPVTLRWRSRLPSDPPFQNEVITYILEYSLDNILVKQPGGYLLDHDFLFPNRSGVVQNFTLDLSFDPAWDAGTAVRHVEKAGLPPGESVLLTIPLQWRGEGAPASTRQDTLPIRLALMAIVLIVPVLIWNRLLNRERALGRFAPLTPNEIDRDWIEKNLLPVRPEVVGAAWDESVGQEEVSAVLARWTGEGKIETKVFGPGDEDLETKTSLIREKAEESNVTVSEGIVRMLARSMGSRLGGLSMTLKVPRESFSGSERALIDALFFAGNETSTDAIKSHYRESGFNPASLLKPDLDREAEALTARGEEKIRISPFPSLILFGATVALFVLGSRNGDPPPALFIFPIVMGLCWVISLGLAANWRVKVDKTENDAGFRVTVAIAVLGAAAILWLDLFSLPLQLAFVIAAIFIANMTMNTARSRRGAKAIAFRKKIASVREYFMNELKKTDPALDDRWFPYIIAFGLNDQATQWMKSFGGVDRSASHHSSSFSGSSSSGSSGRGSGWSGGGGAFGGAGASASWAAAASGIAAGVSAPSSSSSGSGGGSSSGSSGGGGGGGW